MLLGKVERGLDPGTGAETRSSASVGKRTLVEQIDYGPREAAAARALADSAPREEPRAASGPRGPSGLPRLDLAQRSAADDQHAVTDRAVGRMATGASGEAALQVPEHHGLLDGTTAARFGEKLGADFSGVQIHQGDGVAEERGASAVTFGNNIHFSAAAVAAGDWNEGLLGHELVHTVQQGAVPVTGGGPAVQGDTSATEAEAERVGRGAARGEAGQVSLRAPAEAQMYRPPRADRRRDDAQQAMQQGRQQGAADGSAATPASGARAAVSSARAPAPSPQPSATGGTRDGGGGLAPAKGGAGGADVPAASRGKLAGARSGGRPSAADTKLPGGTAAPAAPVAPARPPRPAGGAPALAPAARSSALATPVAEAPAPAISGNAPGAASAQALSAAGRALAQQIQTAGAATAAGIRARAQIEIARLTGERATHTASIHAKVGQARGQIQAHHQAAAASVNASRATAAAQVGATAKIQTAQIGQAAQQVRSQAQQSADVQMTQMDADAGAEAARFRSSSNARDQAQAPASAGGEAADMAAEASTKIGAKATEAFARDTAAVDAETQRAGGEFRTVVAQGISSFHGELGQSHTQATQALESMSSAATAHFASSSQQVTSGLAAFAGQTGQQLEANASSAEDDLSSGADAMIASLREHAEQQATEVEAKAAELAAAVTAKADEMAAGIAGAEPPRAEQRASEARSQLGGIATQAIAQLTAIIGEVGGALGAKASAGSAAMAAGVTRFVSGMDQASAAAGQRIAQNGTASAQQLQMVAQSTAADMQEAGAQSASEMQEGGTKFTSNLQQGGAAARTAVAKTVNQADADQQTNATTFESKKQDAASQASSKHAEVKAEGDRKASAEEQGGQAFLDWILPKSWSTAIKNWAKGFLGEWWTGFLWGLLNGLLMLAVIVAICAVSGPAAPFIVAACIGFAIGAGVANRINTYEAYHGGQTPTGWDLAGSIAIGIADFTGIPNLIEGARGYRFYSGGDADPSRRMSEMEKGENVGGGIAGIIGLIVGARALAKGRAGGAKPGEVKPGEVKPPEAKPDPVKAADPVEPGKGAGGNGTASEFGDLSNMTRTQADAFLRSRDATVKQTAGGYTEYKFPDKSVVWIRPDGEIVRTPAPKYGPDGRRINKGGRLDQNGNPTDSHNTGERVKSDNPSTQPPEESK